MFPIQDSVRSRTFPLVNWLLIAANVFVFFFEVSLPQGELEKLISTLGIVPQNISLANPFTWTPFITHMFLHGGWFHLLSNMWILYIFGDNVEDRMGSYRYFVFYFLGGIAAGLLQTILAVDSNTPAVGASGAIAAVMGAYFLFYPRATVNTLIPIFIFPWFIQVPAVVFLGLWFVSQLFSGFLSLVSPAAMQMGGVAWFAHIGGFAFGLVMANIFTIGRRKPRSYLDEFYPW